MNLLTISGDGLLYNKGSSVFPVKMKKGAFLESVVCPLFT